MRYKLFLLYGIFFCKVACSQEYHVLYTEPIHFMFLYPKLGYERVRHINEQKVDAYSVEVGYKLPVGMNDFFIPSFAKKDRSPINNSQVLNNFGLFLYQGPRVSVSKSLLKHSRVHGYHKYNGFRFLVAAQFLWYDSGYLKYGDDNSRDPYSRPEITHYRIQDERRFGVGAGVHRFKKYIRKIAFFELWYGARFYLNYKYQKVKYEQLSVYAQNGTWVSSSKKYAIHTIVPAFWPEGGIKVGVPIQNRNANSFRIPH